MAEVTLRNEITTLLQSQLLAVLSTQQAGHPYANLIAYAHDGLETLIFATPKTTKKFTNLMADPRVSLLVDNRTNTDTDFHAASALTILGTAQEIKEPELSYYRSLFLARHPSLHDFVNAPTTAMLKIVVKYYILVNRFQQVSTLYLTDEKVVMA